MIGGLSAVLILLIIVGNVYFWAVDPYSEWCASGIMDAGIIGDNEHVYWSCRFLARALLFIVN